MCAAHTFNDRPPRVTATFPRDRGAVPVPPCHSENFSARIRSKLWRSLTILTSDLYKAIFGPIVAGVLRVPLALFRMWMLPPR